MNQTMVTSNLPTISAEEIHANNLRAFRIGPCLPPSIPPRGRWRHSISVAPHTRIATAETEEKWLLFAREHSLDQLALEVQAAIENGRALPRKGAAGLPTLQVTVSFRLTLEEHDLLKKALGKAAAEMQASLGGRDRPDSKAALLHLARRWLETDPSGIPLGREERKESIFGILTMLSPLGPPEGTVVQRVAEVRVR